MSKSCGRVERILHDLAVCPSETVMDGKSRLFVIGAVMLALFLGALDSLIMGAAMPTIVSDLGGLQLYGWVFSSYLLTRAVSLPVFGKLCDLFSSKKLYVAAIGIFIASSILGGAAQGMGQLIAARALQGVGPAALLLLPTLLWLTCLLRGSGER